MTKPHRMRFIIVLLIFSIFSPNGRAQTFSTPLITQEKLKSLGYQVSEEIAPVDVSTEDFQILNAFYQSNVLGEVEMSEYLAQPSESERKAKAAIEAGNCKKGIKYFEQGFSENSSSHLSVAFDYCACLESSGKGEKSIPVLKSLEKDHFYNYEIHRRLASAYNLTGQLALAKMHSSLAVLLNRNHPLIQKEWESIHSSGSKQKVLVKWEPPVESRITAKRISIKGESKAWNAFEACEILWKLDEAHVKLAELKTESHSLEIQAHECLYNAFVADIPNKGKDQLLALADRCLSDKCFNEFIFAHIVLAKDPLLAYLKSQEDLMLLAKFLSKY